MCDCCMKGINVSKCNFCWIEKVLASPLSWILTICVAIIVLCVFSFVLLAFIKAHSKSVYRRFLKRHLEIKIQNEEFEKIIEELKKETAEKIKPYVSKEPTGSYQVNVDEVKKVLDETENKIKKELKDKSDLHKLYLSKLSDSFGD